MTRSGATRVMAGAALVIALLAVACNQSAQSSPIPSSTAVTSTAAPGLAREAPTSTPTPSVVTLVAAGDVMLGRSLGYSITARADAVFDAPITKLLSSADIAVANLESPISDGGSPQAKSYTFRAPPEAAGVLAAAGFDFVGLANNHALDYGQEALRDTVDHLSQAGVASAGAGSDAASALAPVVVEREGVRVAFVSLLDAPPEGDFSRSSWEALEHRPGVAWADDETVRLAVAGALRSADVVVVLLHFGVEFRATPTEGQRRLARLAIDSGASLVVGSHPHVLQEVEEYEGGLIAYSLGNFAFDGFEGIVDESALLRVTLSGTQIKSWELIPITIEWGGRPQLAAQ